MGDIEYDFATGDTSQFEKYLGYKLGIEGYKVEKDSAIYTIYAGVDAKSKCTWTVQCICRL